MNERAPAKVNLVLRVGPRRADGMHSLASLFASLDLADDLTIDVSGADEVVCPGVDGGNLAARALAALRESGANPPPLRVAIEKRIPVAAGLGGGSADAAAVFRAANAMAVRPLDDDRLRSLALSIGSDVPSQLAPGHAVVTATGGVVEPVALPEMELVLVTQAQGLGAAEVYAELDRLRPAAPEPDPAPLRELAGGPLEELAGALENDLEPAALSLRPELGDVLAQLRGAGALGARISGSGPTAFGVFRDRAAADAAAASLPGALVTQLRG